MISATIASVCTLYLTIVANSRECDSVAAACFARIGMAPTMILGTLALLPFMIAIPYIFRQNEKPGFISVLILGCIVSYTVFDALNDVSAVVGYHHTYLLAHALLDSANNVTGNVVGTGASLC